MSLRRKEIREKMLPCYYEKNIYYMNNMNNDGMIDLVLYLLGCRLTLPTEKSTIHWQVVPNVGKQISRAHWCALPLNGV